MTWRAIVTPAPPRLPASAIVKLLPFATVVLHKNRRSAVKPNLLGLNTACLTLGTAKRIGVNCRLSPLRRYGVKCIHKENKGRRLVCLQEGFINPMSPTIMPSQSNCWVFPQEPSVCDICPKSRPSLLYRTARLNNVSRYTLAARRSQSPFCIKNKDRAAENTRS
jgi:hypothetical protein